MSGLSMSAEVGIRMHKRKKKELSEEQKQEIQEAFALFDTDKDDAIDYYELKVNLEGWGVQVTSDSS